MGLVAIIIVRLTLWNGAATATQRPPQPQPKICHANHPWPSWRLGGEGHANHPHQDQKV